MQTEPAPVPTISTAVLRSYFHGTAGVLAYIIETTQVPHEDDVREAVRCLRNVALMLSGSPVERG